MKAIGNQLTTTHEIALQPFIFKQLFLVISGSAQQVQTNPISQN